MIDLVLLRYRSQQPNLPLILLGQGRVLQQLGHLAVDALQVVVRNYKVGISLDELEQDVEVSHF